MSFEAVYIPVGVATFDLDAARDVFEDTKKLLTEIETDIVIPESILLNIDELSVYLDKISPDLIIFQIITFANSAYLSEVLRRFDCPVVLWSVKEPKEQTGRLRLNALTGAFSAGNLYNAVKKEKALYIYGSAGEISKELEAFIKAAQIKKQLADLKLGVIGHAPEGFGFGRGLDSELLSTFGVTAQYYEVRELIDKAKEYTPDDIGLYLKRANNELKALDKIPYENVENFARIFKAYESLIERDKLSAIASRCWPDYFTEFGTPVCAVLSLLNASGIPASCETDIYGALSMYIGQKITDKSPFFGDPAVIDEKENTITFWHCGMASCTLARKDTGAIVGVHPNRKIGPVMDFACHSSDNAVIFRIGRNFDGRFRFFIAKGAILDSPKRYQGTSLVIKTENNVVSVVKSAVKDGWEPHFAVLYGDCIKELKSLAELLKIPVIYY